MSDAGSRHLLSLATLDERALAALLRRAGELADGASPASLQGLTLAGLFHEPSTRTRASFELAAHRVGATMVNLEVTRSSAAKGESLADTVRTLHAMGASLFVVRHPDDGAVSALLDAVGGLPLALVNAGEGRSEHPTQGLIDALTVQQRFGSCSGVRVAIVGDIAHSRVARSATDALLRLGAEVRVAGPAALMPPPGALSGATRYDDFAQALAGAQVVMMLRVQRERIDGALPAADAYFSEWGLTESRLASADADAVVMHPGPFNRGVEIDSAVADGPRSLILKQVANGVAVRVAVLEWAAGGLPA